jgi:transposase-like protein
MKNEIEFPQTLEQAIKYFADADKALNFMATVRWPDGKPKCPVCKTENVAFLSTRRIWKCRDCEKQFSVKVGTIFEDSALGFNKWLPAFWMIVNAKNGISSCELARALGVTQKTAWFMLHRIRLAIQNGDFTKLSGEVEADETYIGGKMYNMHRKQLQNPLLGRGGRGKEIVMGLLERKGKVKLKHVPNTKGRTLKQEIRQHVETGFRV